MNNKKYNPEDSLFFNSLKNHKLIYANDRHGEEIIIKDDEMNNQVMMEWEKYYMMACIDELKPRGDVLEVGFGCGYSATFIQKYEPKSHTIIECDLAAIEKANEWKKGYPESDIRIVEGTWQETFDTLGVFDEIFHDDYELLLSDVKYDGKYEKYMMDILDRERLEIFFDMAIKYHMRKGSRFTYFNKSPWQLQEDGQLVWVSSYTDPKYYMNVIRNPLVEYWEKIITLPLPVSVNCDYFWGNEAIISMITKKFNNEEVEMIDATQYADISKNNTNWYTEFNKQ